MGWTASRDGTWPEPVTGKLSNGESAYILSYGHAFKPNIHAGLSVKILQHSLADYQSTGYGLDAGLLYTLSPKIRLGAAMQDLSTSVSWNTDSELKESYPLVYRLGGCFEPFSHPTRFTLDFAGVQNAGGQIRAGVESEITDNFGVRAGYDGERLVGGGFLAIPMDNFFLELDYSFGKEPIDQSYNHKVSIRIKFRKAQFQLTAGPPATQQKVDAQMRVMASPI